MPSSIVWSFSSSLLFDSTHSFVYTQRSLLWKVKIIICIYIRVSTSTVQLFVIYIQTLTNFLLLFEFAQIIMKSKKFLVAFSKVPQLLSQTFE